MESTLIKSQNQVVSLLDSVEIGEVRNTLGKISQFQSIVQKTLKKGHDYGEIGGVKKPTLLKPGAEKILMLMGLTSEYDIIEKVENYEKGVFAYTIKCILRKNGQKITEGVGSCNSKEDKYRWRWAREDDLPIGIDKDSVKSKVDSYGYTKYRIENDDIYSQVNTILKMAKKRAQIDATLTVASLSEIFTQDIEDMSQFQERENIENMDSSQAENIVIKFGKYKGLGLGQILGKDKKYVEWLSKNAKDTSMRKACFMILNSNSKLNPGKEENHQEEDLYKDTSFSENEKN